MTKSVDARVGEMSADTGQTPGRSLPDRRLRGKGAKGAPARKAISGASRGNKTAQKRSPRVFDPDKLDQFGFRLGSKRAKAAALYASKAGATLAEAKAKAGSPQYNVLTELENKGYRIKRTVDSEGGHKVTRFHVS